MVLSPKINMHIEIRICSILWFKNSKLSLEILHQCLLQRKTFKVDTSLRS